MLDHHMIVIGSINIIAIRFNQTSLWYYIWFDDSHLVVYTSIYLSVCLSVYLSIYLYTCIYLDTYMYMIIILIWWIISPGSDGSHDHQIIADAPRQLHWSYRWALGPVRSEQMVNDDILAMNMTLFCSNSNVQFVISDIRPEVNDGDVNWRFCA